MREYIVTVCGKQHVVTRNADGKFVMPAELAWIRGHSVALKPAFEPIVLARKPLSESTVAANVLRWGTGALNIGACRVDAGGEDQRRPSSGGDNGLAGTSTFKIRARTVDEQKVQGRWPANVVHDGSDEVVGAFPNTGAAKSGGRSTGRNFGPGGDVTIKDRARTGHDDNGGSAARFFYSAKASKADRAGSKHPTVKPIALIQWLARLITPPGGTVLDPFAGSGTTGAACERERFNCILIEREAEYVADIQRRFTNEGRMASLIADMATAFPELEITVRYPRHTDPLARLLRWNAAVASYRTRCAA